MVSSWPPFLRTEHLAGLQPKRLADVDALR
jgi:hypothetical protein